MDLSHFSHLMVLVSIVLGMAITELIGSIGAILRNRQGIILHFPLCMWVVLVCLTLIQFWWAAWQFGRLTLSFGGYVGIILIAILHYLLARIVLPDFSSPDVVAEYTSGDKYDLRSYYLRNVAWMSGVAILLIVLIITVDGILFGMHRSSVAAQKLPYRLVFVALLGIVLITGEIDRRRVKKEAEKAARSGELPKPVYRMRRSFLWAHAVITVVFAGALTLFIIKTTPLSLPSLAPQGALVEMDEGHVAPVER